MSTPTLIHLSASAIAAFKACPTRFRLAYREGLRPAADTDSQRVGTNWHAIHEVYQNTLGDSDHDHALDAAIRHLNERYVIVPDYKTPREWDVERQSLIASFIGYLWFWQDDHVEPIVSELAFKLPVHAPRTGLPLSTKDVVRTGKIDHVVQWHGMIGNVERKSTSKPIDPGSEYWKKSRKDTQVSMYALAFRDMMTAGLLPDEVTQHGDFDPARFGNTLYDVWHKPTIKPSVLTQKATAEFLGDPNTGEHSADYCGQSFQVRFETTVDGPLPLRIYVGGDAPEVEIGKKGFAIRETPAMFGARLLADIQERPEFYYARKEIPRTDKDLRKFRTEIFNIYQAMRQFEKTDCWYENEEQCRATFTCAYANAEVCEGPGADVLCDGKTTPPGYKRIFTDLTIDKTNLNEGE